MEAHLHAELPTIGRAGQLPRADLHPSKPNWAQAARSPNVQAPSEDQVHEGDHRAGKEHIWAMFRWGPVPTRSPEPVLGGFLAPSFHTKGFFSVAPQAPEGFFPLALPLAPATWRIGLPGLVSS